MSSIIDVAIKRLSEHCISERELRIYLKKEFAHLSDDEMKITAAIKRLHELQLLNDLRLATNLAQHYAHKGNRFIAQMLEQKGIAEDVIAKVLLSLDNEDVRALDAARQKLGVNWDNSEKTMNLLHRFLRGRSFSGAAIKSAMIYMERKAPSLQLHS